MALGDKAMAYSDYEETLKHYDGAIDPTKPDMLALYRRGAAQYALGQTDRALSDYEQAIRLNPEYFLAYYGRGFLLANRKSAYERAIGDFNKVLDLVPNSVYALLRRADAYSQIGDLGRSLADLNRAIELAPNNTRAYILRGNVNSQLNQLELAMVDYGVALKLDPSNVNALVYRAALYASAGKVDLAIRDLDAAIAIKGNDASAFYNRGYVHFVKREYQLAIADYSAAIGLDPNMALAYFNRCLTRTITGQDLVEALSDCDVALKSMPHNLDIRDTRGFIYLKRGDPATAVVEYNAALAVDPNRPFTLYGRGIAQIRNGHKDEGEADKTAALALKASVASQFAAYGLD